jgi:hypothetical protein
MELVHKTVLNLFYRQSDKTPSRLSLECSFTRAYREVHFETALRGQKADIETESLFKF